MLLHELKPNKGAKQKTQRLGRGNGSGRGNFSGRGMKGQKARSGGTRRPGFEGGQTPLYKRIPKLKGFKNPTKIAYQVINLSALEIFADDSTVTMDILLQKKIIRKKDLPLKLLGMGDLTKKINIEVHSASKSAIEKIEKKGGSVKVLLAKAESEKK